MLANSSLLMICFKKAISSNVFASGEIIKDELYKIGFTVVAGQTVALEKKLM